MEDNTIDIKSELKELKNIFAEELISKDEYSRKKTGTIEQDVKILNINTGYC